SPPDAGALPANRTGRSDPWQTAVPRPRSVCQGPGWFDTNDGCLQDYPDDRLARFALLRAIARTTQKCCKSVDGRLEARVVLEEAVRARVVPVPGPPASDRDSGRLAKLFATRPKTDSARDDVVPHCWHCAGSASGRRRPPAVGPDSATTKAER